MDRDDLLPTWNGQDLTDLLTLDAPAPFHFRNRLGDANSHGRAYGGQLLAQALMAASRTVPSERRVTSMQFLFLRGALPDRGIEFNVTPLQDGKRFCARHVRGQQSEGRSVLDAQVTFGMPLDAPSHAFPPVPPMLVTEDPDHLPCITDLPAAWGEELERSVGYLFNAKDVLDFRLPEVPPGLKLDPLGPRFRFWLKLRQTLPVNAHLHAAAFAYLSDWWVNYACVGAHVQRLADEHRKLYVASLNHALWLHSPFRADEWLHFDCHSPAAALGRGLCIARVHDRSDRLVASVTQECLMAGSD
jgi:acyl-CoA thioesterase-2